MTRAIFLTGTPIEEPAKRLLQAGALEATFDAGSLRWLRWHGVEVLRAIQFLLRTPGWGTPAPVLEGLAMDDTADHFRISYRARYDGVFADIAFEGTASGNVTAQAQIVAERSFETNRTGFVVLYPLDGFAGTEVEVVHAAAPARTVLIPAQISPGQPLFDISAITHHPRPGLTVATRFSGDIFEMEDHRNWSDASFKVYNRPIGLPYPYLLTPEVPVDQWLDLTITDTEGHEVASSAVTLPDTKGVTLPRIAIPLDRAADAKAALPHAKALRGLGQTLLLRHDGPQDLTALSQLLADTGFALEVQAILHSLNPEAEIASLADAFALAGITIAQISAFPKVDEASFQPGEPRPPHPAEADIAAAIANHFPLSRRGGGTPAFFTEFNRKRPDPALWDFLTFATTPMVHAADDASVIETLQALPHILQSAQALAQGKPLAVGPTGIGARINPYGPQVNDNPPRVRQGMPAADPRQRGLIAAAWHVGYLTQIAPFGIDRFAFGAPTGPFGLISTPQRKPRDWWDDQPEGAVYPLYHIARWLAQAAGKPLLQAATEGGLARLVWQHSPHRAALIANLTDQPLPLAQAFGTAQVLDAARFEQAALHPDRFAETHEPPPATLDAYAVAFLTEAPSA